LKEKRGVQNHLSLPDLTIKQILEWADEHRKDNGVWPNRKSGSVRMSPGETWAIIEGALFKGRRGLPGGLTLAKLFAENRPANKTRAELLTGNFLSPLQGLKSF